jgi:hypothetical protein
MCSRLFFKGQAKDSSLYRLHSPRELRRLSRWGFVTRAAFIVLAQAVLSLGGWDSSWAGEGTETRAQALS